MANTTLTQTGAQVQADLNLLDSNSATLGQVLTANGSGGASWENASTGSVPTVTISLSQVTSQDPLLIQLTQAQYDIFASNKQVIIDVSALGENTVVWNYQALGNGNLYFSFIASDSEHNLTHAYNISIDTNTLIATYRWYKVEDVEEVISFNQPSPLYTAPLKNIYQSHDDLAYTMVQDLTANTAGTLDATAWGNLKTNHTATIASPTMTGFGADYEFVRIKLSINSNNEIVVLTKNTTNKYSGLLFIEESTNLYEISVYYNGTNIILRCATVY